MGKVEPIDLGKYDEGTDMKEAFLKNARDLSVIGELEKIAISGTGAAAYFAEHLKFEQENRGNEEKLNKKDRIYLRLDDVDVAYIKYDDMNFPKLGEFLLSFADYKTQNEQLLIQQRAENELDTLMTDAQLLLLKKQFIPGQQGKAAIKDETQALRKSEKALEKQNEKAERTLIAQYKHIGETAESALLLKKEFSGDLKFVQITNIMNQIEQLQAELYDDSPIDNSVQSANWDLKQFAYEDRLLDLFAQLYVEQKYLKTTGGWFVDDKVDFEREFKKMFVNLNLPNGIKDKRFQDKIALFDNKNLTKQSKIKNIQRRETERRAMAVSRYTGTSYSVIKKNPDVYMAKYFPSTKTYTGQTYTEMYMDSLYGKLGASENQNSVNGAVAKSPITLSKEKGGLRETHNYAVESLKMLIHGDGVSEGGVLSTILPTGELSRKAEDQTKRYQFILSVFTKRNGAAPMVMALLGEDDYQKGHDLFWRMVKEDFFNEELFSSGKIDKVALSIMNDIKTYEASEVSSLREAGLSHIAHAYPGLSDDSEDMIYLYHFAKYLHDIHKIPMNSLNTFFMQYTGPAGKSDLKIPAAAVRDILQPKMDTYDTDTGLKETAGRFWHGGVDSLVGGGTTELMRQGVLTSRQKAKIDGGVNTVMNVVEGGAKLIGVFYLAKAGFHGVVGGVKRLFGGDSGEAFESMRGSLGITTVEKDGKKSYKFGGGALGAASVALTMQFLDNPAGFMDNVLGPKSLIGRTAAMFDPELRATHRIHDMITSGKAINQKTRQVLLAETLYQMTASDLATFVETGANGGVIIKRQEFMAYLATRYPALGNIKDDQKKQNARNIIIDELERALGEEQWTMDKLSQYLGDSRSLQQIMIEEGQQLSQQRTSNLQTTTFLQSLPQTINLNTPAVEKELNSLSGAELQKKQEILKFVGHQWSKLHDAAPLTTQLATRQRQTGSPPATELLDRLNVSDAAKPSKTALAVLEEILRDIATIGPSDGTALQNHMNNYYTVLETVFRTNDGTGTNTYTFTMDVNGQLISQPVWDSNAANADMYEYFTDPTIGGAGILPYNLGVFGNITPTTQGSDMLIQSPNGLTFAGSRNSFIQ